MSSVVRVEPGGLQFEAAPGLPWVAETLSDLTLEAPLACSIF